MEDCRIQFWRNVLGLVYVLSTETHKLKVLLLSFSICSSHSAFSFQPQNLFLCWVPLLALLFTYLRWMVILGSASRHSCSENIPRMVSIRQQMCMVAALNWKLYRTLSMGNYERMS